GRSCADQQPGEAALDLTGEEEADHGQRQLDDCGLDNRNQPIGAGGSRQDVEPGVDDEQRRGRGRGSLEPRRPPPRGDGNCEQRQREPDVEAAPGDVPVDCPVLRRELVHEQHRPRYEHEGGQREKGRNGTAQGHPILATTGPARRFRRSAILRFPPAKGRNMSDSVYRVTEVIGASTESWESAARSAVETAAQTIRDLRVAEATRFDVTIQDGKIASYRVRLNISFKYESGD